MITWNHEQAIKEFPFLAILAENHGKIRKEFNEITHKRVIWPEQYLHNGMWFAYGILFKDKWLPNACPNTTRLVHMIPTAYIAGFSILRPGCVIKPHEGYTNQVLRCHLGIQCPEFKSPVQPLLTVGSGLDKHEMEWEEGKLLVFDDTQTHSVRHPGKQERVVLICDFKRPS